MDKLNLEKENLRKFGLTMGVVFLIITLFILFKHKNYNLTTLIVSAVFFVITLTVPIFLKPIYVIWMRLAYVLSWINTRLILFLLFYLIFTPIGLIMKLFGADLLERKIDKSQDSYWIKQDKKAFVKRQYERQF
ncbi:MAG: SxtJ family membrane protein [Candidatus Omnitrophota bacterium]|nr:SxtJ family membrane protein [Candidatus Omnitrophota bacterium]